MILTDLSSLAGAPAVREAHDGSRASYSVWRENANRAASGGDWCEIVRLSGDRVALTIGDVAGHGPAAAASRRTVRSAVIRALQTTHIPSDVLASANGAAFALPGFVIVTAIVAIFDGARRSLTFANAGHPPAIVCAAGGHAFLGHPPADLPLGVFSTHQSANYVVLLPAPALVVLYTDGITEHDRDPICGEGELAAAARWAFDREVIDVAPLIAERLLAPVRGDDDAAVLALRLA